MDLHSLCDSAIALQKLVAQGEFRLHEIRSYFPSIIQEPDELNELLRSLPAIKPICLLLDDDKKVSKAVKDGATFSAVTKNIKVMIGLLKEVIDETNFVDTYEFTGKNLSYDFIRAALFRAMKLEERLRVPKQQLEHLLVTASSTSQARQQLERSASKVLNGRPEQNFVPTDPVPFSSHREGGDGVLRKPLAPARAPVDDLDSAAKPHFQTGGRSWQKDRKKYRFLSERSGSRAEKRKTLSSADTFGNQDLKLTSGMKQGKLFEASHEALGEKPSTVQKFLDQYGYSEINGRDHNGHTPLYWATDRGDERLVAALLENGADPLSDTSVVVKACSAHLSTPVCLCLLLRYGASPNMGLDGFYPLHVCVTNDHPISFLENLLHSGANLEQTYQGKDPDFQGLTALGFACLYGTSPEIARYLLFRGASLCIPKPFGSKSLLHLAVKKEPPMLLPKQSPLIVEILLRHGHPVDLQDETGTTPAQEAMVTQDREILSILRSHGANLGVSNASKESSTPLMPKVVRHIPSAQPLSALYQDKRISGIQAASLPMEKDNFRQDSDLYVDEKRPNDVDSTKAKDSKSTIARKHPSNVYSLKKSVVAVENPRPLDPGKNNGVDVSRSDLRLSRFSNHINSPSCHPKFSIVAIILDGLRNQLWLQGFSNTLFRPKVPHGHIRITWKCHCTTELYADYPNTDPGYVAKLSQELTQLSLVVTAPLHTGGGRPNTVPIPTAPSAARLAAESSSNTTSSYSNSGAGQLSLSNSTDSSDPTQTPNIGSQDLLPGYFELCVNAGRLCQALGEIDLTRITNDVDLFRWIRRRYKEIRGWKAHWRFCLRPNMIRFVYFGVEQMNKVHILCNDSIPSEDEVAAKRYHFNPCPPKPPGATPMPHNVFLHYLNYCDLDVELPVPQKIWFDKLPKKLGVGVEQQARAPLAGGLVEAWGVHIDEGVDTQTVLGASMILLALVVAPILGAYVALTHNVQTAFAIVCLPVTIILGLLAGWKQHDKARYL